MSNFYLSHHMVLGTETFCRRMHRIYDAWMNPDTSVENDGLSSVDCFVVTVGDDYSKSVLFHKWLFGYELNNTICVFTRDTVRILANKKEIDFLKPAENDVAPKMQLLVRGGIGNDSGNFIKLLEIMKLSRNGKKIGVFSGDDSTGRFCESWRMEMNVYNFETIDISTSTAYIMAVKEESELAAIRNACLVSTEVFQSYLKPHILEIINNEQDVKHSQLAEGLKRALTNKKIIPDEVDTDHLELCYSSIIQSGGNYSFDYNVGSDQNYLQPGAIVCSLGVRYKSYCSNISRTLLPTEPSKAMQSNYDFIQNLERQLLKKLIPGNKLCEIYDSAMEYAKKVRPDLIDHLSGIFGFAIGIEFRKNSLAIGPKCTEIVRQNMVFNVCIRLSGLTCDDSSDNASKTYALCHSDTVIVNASPDPATILTSTDLPPYLKLLVDCWEHIMDFLSFEDLLRMGQTCKAMNQLTGCYIRENRANGYVIHNEKIKYNFGETLVEVPSNFWRFIKGLWIGAPFNFNFDFNVKRFPALKSLSFRGYSLNGTQFQHFKNVLMNIENMDLQKCNIPGETVDQLVNCCPNLKCLRIYCCNVVDADPNVWFSKNYPALENFQYTQNTNMQIDDLKIFLEKHSKLKHFETTVRILWANRDLINETNIKLDVLTIWFSSPISVPVIQFFEFIKTLHERDFYKTLCFKIANFEIVYNYYATLPSNLASLGFLRVRNLHVYSNEGSADEIEFIARNLIELEVLNIGSATFDQILPFIRHSKSLKTIKIFKVSNGFFDLFALNEERKKLANAAQVTIHLPEKVYLAEIWKAKNANLEHVRVVRYLYDL